MERSVNKGRARARGLVAAAFGLLAALSVSQETRADLCNSVQDADAKASAETKRDVDFYESLFPDSTYFGKRGWNEKIVQCNRQRDNKGDQIAKITQTLGTNPDRKQLESKNLDYKVIRGHYNFFGTLATRMKYVYVLSKENNVWKMVIPYDPIINDVVKDRIDFDMDGDGHAFHLYDASQIVDPKAEKLELKPTPKPIAQTLCSDFTYFSGSEGKYDKQTGKNASKRDKENKFISLGRIEFYYDKSEFLSLGCRVKRDRDVYWVDSKGKVRKSRADDWVLDNFVRAAEGYWTIPGVFELQLLMKGRNESKFPKALTKLLNDGDHLTVYFATKFLPYGDNQMYKSNIIEFNNFSTMSSDGTYWHEVGHAFGLDDEYAKDDSKPNGCKNSVFEKLTPTTYEMCKAGAPEQRTIYHYLAATRYITTQSECSQDPDCATDEYCDKGVDTTRNQCVSKKSNNDACSLVDGGRQCKSGYCKVGRCYDPNSVAMGGTCYVDDACKLGKCSSIDGTKGTCVCKQDADCNKSGYYCNAGLDLSKNECLAQKTDNSTCDIAGGAHQCKSGYCQWSHCYTPNSVATGGTCYVDDACKLGKCSSINGTKGTCVCKSDADCGDGRWCDGGADLHLNVCKNKLNKGDSCGTALTVGNDHKCKSGECSGFPNYVCK
ncbi:MAG TPA: hypothetical protein VHM70_21530 [Polyangiaceae bacterium]|jgi:hypothetical protein|nr:hypothetical protein [Polyangiaceae bacterium]